MTADGLVAVVDDDEGVRRALERLLRANGFEVRSFGSAEEFLAAHRTPGPACLVLDLRLPGRDGLQLQSLLGDRAEILPIIFISGHGDVPTSVKAMKRGAVDFLSKPFEEADLNAAVRLALDRARALLAARVERDRARALVARLSPREREVLGLVVVGMMNKEIASNLGIAEKTVKLHRGRMTSKLGLRSVADLVRFAQAASVDPTNGIPDG